MTTLTCLCAVTREFIRHHITTHAGKVLGSELRWEGTCKTFVKRGRKRCAYLRNLSKLSRKGVLVQECAAVSTHLFNYLPANHSCDLVRWVIGCFCLAASPASRTSSRCGETVFLSRAKRRSSAACTYSRFSNVVSV